MKAMRHLYRQEFLQPLLVALFLFQVRGAFLGLNLWCAPLYDLSDADDP
jgi:hypothetical protein